LPKTLSSGGTVDPAASASVFAALGDETRLRLISRLCDDGPLSITELSTGFPITRQAITKHLHVMEHAGLVQSTLQGRQSIWRVEQKRLADARRHLRRISSQWDATLDRLKRFVEH
jgi:DNA-binding transcriptional ArsR family regulator